jgi:DNA polymerase II large subunit
MNTKRHFQMISDAVDKAYEAAEKARAVGIDPVSKVETPLAISLAEKAVGLISVVYPQLQDKRIVNRILDLEKENGQLDVTVAMKIAEEIAKEKYCKFESLVQAIEAGIRVGFAYVTLGVVSSPIEGFTKLKLGKTKDGKEYFKVYFSGPIRSAGTTAACVCLMIIDYLRETMGFAKYDITEDEVKRYVTENYDYHERVTNLQYLPTEEEIIYLAERIPIQIAGEPTEKREVSNYKDLERVETNFIRGGMCLIFSEGLAQKAQKGFRLLKGAKENGIKSTGWDFLDEFITKFKMDIKSKKGDSVPVYMKDIVAGRPIFGHPGKSGGFRFRYGRCRTNGFSAAAVHPGTMAITDSFISYGTQLKIEKPTKGCAVGVCDDMDGPIVRLKDGSVKKVNTYQGGKKLYKDVEEILYLGDLLVPLGDVINRNYDLLKQGYVEEWWKLELEKAGNKIEIDEKTLSLEEAIVFSKKFNIPLHPSFIFYWTEISYDGFMHFLDWLARGSVRDGKIILPYTNVDKERFVKGKRALELLGIEHEVSIENVVLDKINSKALMLNLGVELNGDFEKKIDSIVNKIPKEGNVLDVVNSLSDFIIKDKAGTFIGARMGKPEKAKLRKLIGSPHVLFPVASEGGRLRSVQAAVEVGSVNSDFPNYYCSKCKTEGIYPKCEICEGKAVKRPYCFRCQTHFDGECPTHGEIMAHKARRIDVREYFDKAKKKVGLRIDELPAAVKGVRGTSSQDHDCENLAKGLLRAKYNLHVNKDGTIRYDIQEMPLTHFNAFEIGTSIEKLKDLGYENDINGKGLENDQQILELLPHDIVLPACPESDDENADDVFVNVCNFVDDELEKLYGQERYFNLKDKKDLIGQLFACIAPHICTATVGRVIGFSKTQTFLASPFMHAAMRRDCDGDEAAVILLMDMLINFSRKFLPAHRGGTQDAPLVLNSKINAGEVDDQILDFEIGAYPLELYELAEQGKHSSEVNIETVKDRLREEKNPFVGLGYTHKVSNVNSGAINSSYKSLPTMKEKVEKQMDLCVRLRAVDSSDVARLIIERHFIRDIRGNLRKFCMQGFRCVKCNEKFRRPPLVGKCTNCGGKIIFTISEGSIVKYMQGALDLAYTHNVNDYLKENLDLIERWIASVFGKDAEKQESLGRWF